MRDQLDTPPSFLYGPRPPGFDALLMARALHLLTFLRSDPRRILWPLTSGVRGGRSGALKNVQGHVVSRDTWCPRRAVRERRRPSQDSWPSWDSTVLGQRKCPGTKRGVLGQPTPSQDGDCPGHRVSRDTFASRTPFASQDIPPDPQMFPCAQRPCSMLAVMRPCE